MIYIIFTSMLIHGVSPGDLLLSTLVPIPKYTYIDKITA